MTISEQSHSKDNTFADKECDERDNTNRDLQEAYLWMKKKKNLMEKMMYEESKIYCVDGNGQIVGWTENAVRLFKNPRSSLLNKNLSDFLKITDGRSFKDIFPLVKPSFPYIINVSLTDGSTKTPVYNVKVTSLMLEGRNLFYLVFYNSREE